MLIVDGQWYTQSNAIHRYTGKLAGLYPEDPLLALRVRRRIDREWAAAVRQAAAECAACIFRRPNPSLSHSTLSFQVDELLDVVNEILVKAPKGADAEETKTLREAWTKDGLAKYAAYIDGVLGSEWAVGDKMTIADLAITFLVTGVTSGLFEGIAADCLDSFTNMKRVVEKTLAVEAVKAWAK